MGTNDSRGGGKQPKSCTYLGFSFTYHLPGPIFKIVNTVEPGFFKDLLKRRFLFGCGRYNQLATAPDGYMPIGAIVIQLSITRDTECRLERTGLIIDPGMNDFTIATADALPILLLAIQHQQI